MHQIGVGVLGPVFRTYEPSEDRLVAVKAFHLDITPEQTQTLVDGLTRVIEADLSHTGVVAPIDVGLEDGVPYMAQEYVAAESLDVAMRHYAPAPVETAMPFIRQMAEAIDAAHARGIVHGALHLRDIFLTPDDVRITGFGVVKALEELRLAGPIRRPYTAPEVISGIGWGSEADVFALAAVAYELLTGRRAAGTGEQVTERLNAVEGVADGEALQAVFATALSDSPDDRYSSAARFVSSLESAIGHEGSGAAKLPTEQAPKPSAQPPDLLAGLDLYRDDDVLPSRADLADKKTADPTPPVSAPTFESLAEDDQADAVHIDGHEDQAAEADDHGGEPEPAVEALEVEDGSFESVSVSDEVSAVDEHDDDAVVAADTPDTSEEPVISPPDLFAAEVLDPPDLPEVTDVRVVAEAEDDQAEEEAIEAGRESVPLDQDDVVDVGDGDPGGPSDQEELDGQEDQDDQDDLYDQDELVADAGAQAGEPSESGFAATQSLPEADDEPAYVVPPDVADAADDTRRSWVSRGAVPIVAATLTIGAIAYFVTVGLGPDDGPTDQVLGEQDAADAASLEFSEEVVNAGQPDGGGGAGDRALTSEPTAAPQPEPAPAPPTVATPEPAPVVSAPPPPPAAPAPAPAPAATGSGWLLVRTDPPGAAVTVDGVSRGETPLSLEDVAYGEHEVGIGLTGFSSVSQSVTISAADTVARVGLTLTPLRNLEPQPRSVETGPVDVASRPTGARIIVDGELVGTTPARLNLPVGRRLVRIELDGYQAWSKTVAVRSDENDRVAASLERPR